jgi:hypothetical protein
LHNLNLFLSIMFKLRNVVFSLAIFSTAVCSAQTVSVKKDNARIKNVYADGFQVDLEGTYEEVETALVKQMKTYGKVKSDENYNVVNEPVIKGSPYTQPIYSVTKQVGNIISAWVGVKKDDWKENDAQVVNQELETMLYNFGVNFYREKIQKQIDESVRAQMAVEKQQQRLINQNKDLNNKVENNKKEKIRLDQALVENKIEMESLIRRLEKNKKDQDSVSVAADQIKKVVEKHKERQQSVH